MNRKHFSRLPVILLLICSTSAMAQGATVPTNVTPLSISGVGQLMHGVA